jgi:hypothetical protein
VIAALGRLPRLNQLGLVVRDLDSAMSSYGAALGVATWYRSRMASFRLFFRGDRIDMDWDIVVGYSGRVQVELIRVHEAGPNLYHELLGPMGSGFHHLGVVVRDFDRRLERASGAGLEVLQHGAIDFAGGGACRFAYFDTVPILGFILELIEMKVYGLQLGLPEWLLRAGTLTGGVDRLD